jgi:hypothetical protein
LPRVDVFGEEFTSKVKSIGDSFGYSVQEVRQSSMTNKRLPEMKASAARKAIEQKVNRIAWNGDAAGGILGLLNQPNVPAAVTAAGGTTGFLPWIGASPKNTDEILVDLNGIVDVMFDLTKGVEIADTILLPNLQYSKINSTARSTTSDTTIKQFFMNNRPEITLIEAVNELKAVNPLPSGDSGTKDVMVAYKRSPDKLKFHLPIPFEQMAPQAKSLEFEVPCHARCGGLVIYYPLSVSIMEGI